MENLTSDCGDLQEELAAKEAFSLQGHIPSSVDQQGGDRVSTSRKTCLSSPEVF